VQALLQRAASLLTDAGNASLSPASRFSLAYDAAFALATAALRLRGYRPDTARGHRAVVFRTLPHSVGAPTELWAALAAAHDRRNALEYTAALAPTRSEVEEVGMALSTVPGECCSARDFSRRPGGCP
jgi:hypothetical protein